jgi:superfamily II DNA/RNA helicase
VTIEVAQRNATASTVEQHFFSVSDEDKRRAVRQSLRERSLSQALVFVNSKLGAARLARSFERDGLKTAALHGDKSQDERLKSLAAFKNGEVELLVATDVAARGLDIVDLPAVINFDVPFNAEDYVHRIGRTGRAGQSGLAITLVTRDDARLVSDIEKLIKKKLEIEPFEFDDERPRRPRRTFEEREPEERAPRAPQAETRRPPVAAPIDPFFDVPYEPPSGAAEPMAVAAGSPTPAPARTGLPNIRPKKKVAALLGGSNR